MSGNSFDKTLFVQVRELILENLPSYPRPHLRQFYFLLIHAYRLYFQTIKHQPTLFIQVLADAISDLKTAIQEGYIRRGNSLKIKVLNILCSWYISLARRSGEEKERVLQAAENFIRTIDEKDLVLPKGYHPQYAKAYDLMRLDFERKAFNTVKKWCNAADNKTPHSIQKFQIVCLHIKAIYEEGDFESAILKVNAFVGQINRDKLVHQAAKEPFLGFCRFVKKLISKGKRDKITRNQLIAELRSPAHSIAEKDWLSQKLNALSMD